MRRLVHDLWGSQRLRRLVRSVALVLVFGVLLANRPDCDRRQPNLTCDDMSINVSPGDCIDITNPCDPSGEFSRVDGFRLCDAPDGIFVRTNRSRSGSTREICAALNVGSLENEPATFIYATPGNFGEGGITITTGFTTLGVTVSASPASVPPGDPVDLSSMVTGGNSPYTYSWSSNPPGQIVGGDIALPNPTVNPTVNVTFTLEVVDDDGNTATDSVSVGVGLGLVLSPDVAIPVGGSTQLLATVSGGDGSYTYGWLPAAGLDFQTIADPLASPSTTTTYSVLVSDGSGASASGQVTVTVTLEATASANPSTIDAGQSSQLDVQPAGGDGNYSYSWAPADGLPGGSNLQSPQVTPTATTTYQVTVSDGLGQSVTENVTVTVNPVMGLVACFTWAPDPPVLFTTTMFDGQCSSGPVDLIRWSIFWVEGGSEVFDWPFGDGANFQDPALPDSDDGNGWTMSYPFEIPGTYEVTLVVRNSSTGDEVILTETFILP